MIEKRWSIKTKLLLALVFISLIPGAIGSVIIFQDTTDKIAHTKLNDLMNIIDAKYIHLLDFLKSQRHYVVDLGSDEFIHQGLIEYNKAHHVDQPMPGRLPSFDELSFYLKRLRESSKLDKHIMGEEKAKGVFLKEVFGRDVKWDMYRLDERLYRYEEIFLMDTNGKVVASSKAENIGTDMSEKGFFIKGKEGLFTQDVYEDSDGKTVFGFSSPVIEEHYHGHRDSGQDGELLGVVGIKVGTEFLTDLVTGDLGNQIGGKLFFAGYTSSSDFYLINSEGYMITQPKVLKGVSEAVLRQQARTLPWQRCTDDTLKVREAQEFYPNYNGTEVGGASMCVFDMKWTIVAEQNKDEILLLSYHLMRTIIAISLIVAALVGFLAYYL
ncbi:MAG: cache domain-containing protein, partial [Deltaproteobacteria bacterium]|nr:cache domain-containing protein [Deltaproteobacteria bacterium]